MSSQVANHLLRRLARSSAASQRCGCSVAAGPSVMKQAHREQRKLHMSARTQQEAERPKQAASQQVNTNTAPESKTRPSAAPQTTPISSTQNTSTPLASTKARTLDFEGSETAVDPATEATPSTLPSFSFARPKQHPRTHGNQVCTLHLSSYSDDLPNLTFFSQFCVHAAYAFGLPCSLPASLPTKSSLRTVPRSPFVHKPSQQNFVKKEHKRQLKIFDSDIGAVGQWIDYISENSMSGVRIKATMWENKPVGFGKNMAKDTQMLETSEAQKVKEMAESLLASGFGEEGTKQTSESDREAAGEAAGKPDTERGI